MKTVPDEIKQCSRTRRRHVGIEKSKQRQFGKYPCVYTYIYIYYACIGTDVDYRQIARGPLSKRISLAGAAVSKSKNTPDNLRFERSRWRTIVSNNNNNDSLRPGALARYTRTHEYYASE